MCRLLLLKVSLWLGKGGTSLRDIHGYVAISFALCVHVLYIKPSSVSAPPLPAV